MGSVTPSQWKLPTPDSLPGAEASFEEIVRFARATDPTAHFHVLWRENYQANVEALWHRCVQSYKAGAAATGAPDELLMCLSYDVVLGPHLGVPEPQKLSFLRWLVEGIRRGLWGRRPFG